MAVALTTARMKVAVIRHSMTGTRVPQGILPGVFKVTGTDAKAWFLALYLPSWAQWPTLAGMMLAGVALGSAGVSLMQKRTAPRSADARRGADVLLSRP